MKHTLLLLSVCGILSGCAATYGAPVGLEASDSIRKTLKDDYRFMRSMGRVAFKRAEFRCVSLDAKSFYRVDFQVEEAVANILMDGKGCIPGDGQADAVVVPARWKKAEYEVFRVRAVDSSVVLDGLSLGLADVQAQLRD